MASMWRIARGVSIMAQSRVASEARCVASAISAAAIASGSETFGSRIASGPASAAARRSASPQGVPSPFTRITTSRRPNPPAFTAAQTCVRAKSLVSGATESSRSRITASAGKVRAFSIARAFAPGM